MWSKPATLAARHAAFRGPELRFQLANMSSSLVSGGAEPYPAESWRESARGAKPSAAMLPLQFVVPGTALPDANARAEFVATQAVMDQGVASSVRLPSGAHTLPLPRIMPGTDTIPITRIAAMSSAAAAFLGSESQVKIVLFTLASQLLSSAYDGGGDALPPLQAGDWSAQARAAFPVVASPSLDSPSLGALATTVETFVVALRTGLAQQLDELAELAPAAGSGGAVDTPITPACRAVLDGPCAQMYDEGASSSASTLPGAAAAIRPRSLVMCVLGMLHSCSVAPLSYLADMAVCADNAPVSPVEMDQRACAFPRPRIADGGYVDNLGAAQTLGALQRQSPPGSPLRLIITMNSEYDPGDVQRWTDLRNLFSANGGQGYQLGLQAPSATVFSTPWADVAFKAVRNTSYVNAVELSSTTVANEVYDVTAGSRVELLAFSLDGPIRLTIGASALLEDYEALGLYAADAARVEVQDVVRKWLARTSSSIH
jgi:hypothetical protein